MLSVSPIVTSLPSAAPAPALGLVPNISSGGCSKEVGAKQRCNRSVALRRRRSVGDEAVTLSSALMAALQVSGYPQATATRSLSPLIFAGSDPLIR